MTNSLISDTNAPISPVALALKTILNCPNSLEEYKSWKKSNFFREWVSAWLFFKNLNRIQYIDLVGNLPSLLLEADFLPFEAKRSWHFQQVRKLYKGVALWVAYLTDYDDLTQHPSGWEWCQADGYRAKARWDLAKAVLAHDSSHERFYSQGFFPSGHLWFWTEVCNCMKSLKASGLVKPLPHTKLKGKSYCLKIWGKYIQELENLDMKNMKNMKDWTEVSGLYERLKNIDIEVLGDALQGKYEHSVEAEEEDPLTIYIKAEKFARRTAKESSNAQAVVSYVFPDECHTRTYVGTEGKNLPKPPKQPPKRKPSSLGFVKKC